MYTIGRMYPCLTGGEDLRLSWDAVRKWEQFYDWASLSRRQEEGIKTDSGIGRAAAIAQSGLDDDRVLSVPSHGQRGGSFLSCSIMVSEWPCLTNVL